MRKKKIILKLILKIYLFSSLSLSKPYLFFPQSSLFLGSLLFSGGFLLSLASGFFGFGAFDTVVQSFGILGRNGAITIYVLFCSFLTLFLRIMTLNLSKSPRLALLALRATFLAVAVASHFFWSWNFSILFLLRLFTFYLVVLRKTKK